jgi:hypothetical protein
LRAGIFAGTVGLLPAVAFADTGAEATAAPERIDHQTAEAKGAGAVTGSSAANDAAPRVPDHATAEARGASADAGLAGNDMTAGVPDHAEAQARTPAPAPSNP